MIRANEIVEKKGIAADDPNRDILPSSPTMSQQAASGLWIVYSAGARGIFGAVYDEFVDLNEEIRPASVRDRCHDNGLDSQFA